MKFSRNGIVFFTIILLSVFSVIYLIVSKSKKEKQERVLVDANTQHVNSLGDEVINKAEILGNTVVTTYKAALHLNEHIYNILPDLTEKIWTLAKKFPRASQMQFTIIISQPDFYGKYEELNLGALSIEGEELDEVRRFESSYRYRKNGNVVNIAEFLLVKMANITLN